ncbi:MAG: PEP-CTERM sorting domain-containing protein [Planctomycetes bacterium]|nr:PEP-CTERM sorting domain-containing protein [Planctomycetota bacterium]
MRIRIVMLILLMAGGIVAPAAAEVVTNPLSAFPITIDGAFTDGIDPFTGEWSDVTPVAFISPPNPGGALTATTLIDPNANAFTYAVLAPGSVVPTDAAELYLLYDYLPRTNSVFAEGEFIGDISFEIHLDGSPDATPITVQLRGASAISESLLSAAAASSPFDVFIDAGALGFLDAEALGIEVAIGFGASPHSATEHMIVELEVGLTVDSSFFNPNTFPPGGGPEGDGVYSPAPSFWGGGFANDAIDPPATAAIFQINPDGSTTITSISLAAEAVPEPATILLLALALPAMLWQARRRMAPKRKQPLG